MYPDECDSTKTRVRKRSMGRERETRITVGNSTDDSKQQLEKSYDADLRLAIQLVFRAELGMHPLKTNRDTRKLKLQNKAKEHTNNEVACHS